MAVKPSDLLPDPPEGARWIVSFDSHKDTMDKKKAEYYTSVKFGGQTFWFKLIKEDLTPHIAIETRNGRKVIACHQKGPLAQGGHGWYSLPNEHCIKCGRECPQCKENEKQYS